jgi:hypothetical protein
MGGLGNQLFQIFTTLSYAIKSGHIYNFSNAEILGGGSTTVRHTYWNSLFKELQPFTIDKFEDLTIIREKSFEYNDIMLIDIKAHQNVMLYGYFQSFKYFQQEFASICNLIKIKEIKQRVLQTNGLDQGPTNSSISLHFRIGDYKKIQQCHPIMKYSYYEKALSYILQKSTNVEQVLYFCEDEDIDDATDIIYELKNRFKQLIFTRCPTTLSDWEQMLVMSACRHNIIANSSFSWWAAYLNENVHKIVCYPSNWFGPSIKHNTIDLFPDNWAKIKCE